jgi:hypothetical protein
VFSLTQFIFGGGIRLRLRVFMHLCVSHSAKCYNIIFDQWLRIAYVITVCAGCEWGGAARGEKSSRLILSVVLRLPFCSRHKTDVISRDPSRPDKQQQNNEIIVYKTTYSRFGLSGVN